MTVCDNAREIVLISSSNRLIHHSSQETAEVTGDEQNPLGPFAQRARNSDYLETILSKLQRGKNLLAINCQTLKLQSIYSALNKARRAAAHFFEWKGIVSVAKGIYANFSKQRLGRHNPQEIWKTQTATVIEALQKAKLTAKDIVAVGITNQRETSLCWNRKTGEPVYNAIVWQDRRTSTYCDNIRKNYGEFIRDKTGLEVDAYFSASKIRWILENVEGARKLAEIGDLAFGTIDCWLV